MCLCFQGGVLGSALFVIVPGKNARFCRVCVANVWILWYNTDVGYAERWLSGRKRPPAKRLWGC